MLSTVLGVMLHFLLFFTVTTMATVDYDCYDLRHPRLPAVRIATAATGTSAMFILMPRDYHEAQISCPRSLP